MAIFKPARAIRTGLAPLMPQPENSLPLTADLTASDPCPLSEARCDISIMESVNNGVLSLDGDLLSVSYRTGWKLREPGLEALIITGDE